jgi:hypothetical protein
VGLAICEVRVDGIRQGRVLLCPEPLHVRIIDTPRCGGTHGSNDERVRGCAVVLSGKLGHEGGRIEDRLGGPALGEIELDKVGLEDGRESTRLEDLELRWRGLVRLISVRKHKKPREF